MDYFTPISVVLPGAGQFPGARVTRSSLLMTVEMESPLGQAHTQTHTQRERERDTCNTDSIHALSQRQTQMMQMSRHIRYTDTYEKVLRKIISVLILDSYWDVAGFIS